MMAHPSWFCETHDGQKPDESIRGKAVRRAVTASMPEADLQTARRSTRPIQINTHASWTLPFPFSTPRPLSCLVKSVEKKLTCLTTRERKSQATVLSMRRRRVRSAKVRVRRR